MNAEQLKLILEAFNSAGVLGKEAFIWWLVFDKAIPPIAWLIGLAGLFWAAYRIAKMLSDAREEIQFARRVRDELGVGSSGYLTQEESARAMKKLLKILGKPD